MSHIFRLFSFVHSNFSVFLHAVATRATVALPRRLLIVFFVEREDEGDGDSRANVNKLNIQNTDFGMFYKPHL